MSARSRLPTTASIVVGADPWVDDDLSQYSEEPVAEAAGAELPAARRDLQHRHPQRRSERGHRRGDHAGVEGVRPVGAGDQGRQADHRLRQGRDEARAMPAMCSMSRSTAATGISSASSTSRTPGAALCLHDREGRHAQRHRDQRHGAAGERGSHLDLRLPQASDPRRGAAAQGRRLEGAGRNADHGGVRRHHRLCRRRQGLRQRHPHRPWRRQGDRLRAYEPLRADHAEGPRGACRRRHRLCRHDRPFDRPASAFRALPERRPDRSAGRFRDRARRGHVRDDGEAPAGAGWSDRRSRRPTTRRPTAPPSKSWSTASSMSRAAARRAPRTRNRRPPGLASSSSRPGSG